MSSEENTENIFALVPSLSFLYIHQVVETDHFDTTVTGPWIGRWEITNRNKHTEAFTSAT